METERRRFCSEEPSARKRKTPPPPSSSEEKLCIIVCASDSHLKETDGPVNTFHIFILDLCADGSDCREQKLGSEKPPFKPPTFRIGDDCLSLASFCALGSTLYFFEYESVYKYKLPSNVSNIFNLRYVSNIFNLRLQRDMLVKIPDMLAHKKYPIFTVPTPDMKSILVFSSVIDECATDHMSEFEMYDSESGSWIRLAGIPLSSRQSSFRITSYTFMDNHHVLLLRMDCHTCFTLDIKSPDQPCQRLPFDDPRTLPVLKRGYFIVAGGGHLCLSPTLAYDIRQDKGESGMSFFEYPQLPSLNHFKSERLDRAVTLLRVDDGGCKFCVAQTEMSLPTFLLPQVTVTVYELDLHQYEKSKEKGLENQVYYGRLPNLPCTRAVKSFRFQPYGDDLSVPLRLAYISAVGFN